jgi:heat shock protein HslJ
MKKFIAIIALSVFMIACNSTETKTITISADSIRIDSAAQNVLDSTKQMINRGKVLVDSAKSKIERAADKVIEGANKIKIRVDKK